MKFLKIPVDGDWCRKKWNDWNTRITQSNVRNVLSSEIKLLIGQVVSHTKWEIFLHMKDRNVIPTKSL